MVASQATVKVDNSSWLESGQYRNSVRMHSKKHYNGGLFILDVDHVPTGCSSRPAFWFCGPDWPIGGEVRIFCQSQGRAPLEAGQIDIMEGIHLGTRNQMTLHTDYGVFSGEALVSTYGTSGSRPSAHTNPLEQETDCKSSSTQNAGCGIVAEDNTAGPAFNARGGGVYAMQWDGSGIQIFAKRYQVMFTHGSPDRYRGEPPMRHFRRADVTLTYFFDMQIIFGR
ncbi:hypothetical protein QFC20_001542 [Naganishia adeliensis]|uniref:Uncharacterized protein n=1 Tax=Naganishia adeliensis TaxID=92952 RepID=A0ACC2WRK8_9TREE|nr:hypothetical protein QFC20_001542 [Naganishia adeliensis]